MINNLLVSSVISRLCLHPMGLKISSLHGVKPWMWLNSCSLHKPVRVSSLERLTVVIKDLG